MLALDERHGLAGAVSKRHPDRSGASPWQRAKTTTSSISLAAAPQDADGPTTCGVLLSQQSLSRLAAGASVTAPGASPRAAEPGEGATNMYHRAESTGA